MRTNDGGPAFPSPDTVHPSGQVQYGSFGMTLRDWFAGQALAGIAVEDVDMNEQGRWAYRLADAMIAAREKGNE